MSLSRSIAVACFLFAASPALAQGWSADARTGCRVANPHPQPNETVTWSGPCGADKIADGSGILQWYENGRPTEHYDGEVRNGEYSGHGNLTIGGGGHYVGEFLNGQANGSGTLTTARGETLSGIWKDGCFSQGGRVAWIGADPATCH